MVRVLVPLVLLALTVYTLVDCIQTDDAEQQHLPKILWMLVILLFPPVGPIAWLIAGRPNAPINRTGPPGTGGGQAPGTRGQAPRGPDDDPDFLRRL
ncbi:MAG TPA: PLD nuclease N-terminal domain-containing protein [Segeticoccus sp.]|uniref:PLD nuclease N-terminal domain-containing protein n=1 Tax=Segeticoccus sp. TaxID=2706531 RepID=UPI002D7F9050|nr:PLD nuclease N-terminal domain-containing protein [Segeticoccus sp.]HET8601076.1 PLD nuclease N-terminal domain-containing protein [Segeticoccus sp.]